MKAKKYWNEEEEADEKSPKVVAVMFFVNKPFVPKAIADPKAHV